MEPVGNLEAMATKNKPTRLEAEREIVRGTLSKKVFLISRQFIFLINLGPMPEVYAQIAGISMCKKAPAPTPTTTAETPNLEAPKKMPRMIPML